MESTISKIAIMLVPALFAIMVHEVSHGFVAEKFGDPTARLLGRLNLNPLRHIDPLGTIAIFIFGFGWARPVPVNPANFRHPQRDMIWVALAGPLSNMCLALCSALGLHGLGWCTTTLWGQQALFQMFARPVGMMLGFSLYINTLLAVFNLLPLPPLDGGRIMTGMLPRRAALLLSRFEPFGFLLIVVLVFFTDLWSVLLAPVIHGLVIFLAGDQIGYVERTISFLFGR